jgi:hypothetical protein
LTLKKRFVLNEMFRYLWLPALLVTLSPSRLAASAVVARDSASPLLKNFAKNMAGAALGRASAGEKEGCFVCEMVMRRAASLVGPPRLALSAEDMGLAIQEGCSALPTLALQACETLIELKEDIAVAYFKRISLDDICEKVAQLCWPGLLV